MAAVAFALCDLLVAQLLARPQFAAMLIPLRRWCLLVFAIREDRGDRSGTGAGRVALSASPMRRAADNAIDGSLCLRGARPSGSIRSWNAGSPKMAASVHLVQGLKNRPSLRLQLRLRNEGGCAGVMARATEAEKLWRGPFFAAGGSLGMGSVVSISGYERVHTLVS